MKALKRTSWLASDSCLEFFPSKAVLLHAVFFEFAIERGLTDSQHARRQQLVPMELLQGREDDALFHFSHLQDAAIFGLVHSGCDAGGSDSSQPDQAGTLRKIVSGVGALSRPEWGVTSRPKCVRTAVFIGIVDFV